MDLIEEVRERKESRMISRCWRKQGFHGGNFMERIPAVSTNT